MSKFCVHLCLIVSIQYVFRMFEIEALRQTVDGYLFLFPILPIYS